MNPNQIKEQRLSEDSTTESTTSTSVSVSGDSEETDRTTDEDTGGATVKSGLTMTEEEFNLLAANDPAIAGRYTDADPSFRDDKEQLTPPIVRNYAPRRHDRRGRGRFQNRFRHSHGHGQQQYGNNRGYHHQGGGGGNYRNRQGGQQQSQQDYRYRNPRQSDGGSDRGGHHQSNRFHDQQRPDAGPRGQKRKSDHSQSSEPNSQFYARPVANKCPREDPSCQGEDPRA